MHAGLRRALRLASAPAALIGAITQLPPAVPREITVPEEQFERALRHAPPYLELVMLLAHEAGLRINTARLLTRGHCDFETRRILGRTKGGARFDIPMTARLHDRILWFCAAAQADDEPLTAVFRLPRETPKLETLRKALSIAKREAGIVHCSWGMHDLRRSLARKLYLATGDLHKVQALLGHRMLHTTCWYLGNGLVQLRHGEIEGAASRALPNPSEEEQSA